MTTRKPMSKKTRFAVFARDAFTCQYCGRQPPSVVLEVDHIIPVVDGGTDDNANLRTSCFTCNRGKGRTVITDGVNPIERLARLQEIAEDDAFANQIYDAIKTRERIRHNATHIICEILGLECCSERHVTQFVNCARADGVSVAMEWIQIAQSNVKRTKHHARYEDDCFRYFHGIRRKTNRCEVEQ